MLPQEIRTKSDDNSSIQLIAVLEVDIGGEEALEIIEYSSRNSSTTCTPCMYNNCYVNLTTLKVHCFSPGAILKTCLQEFTVQ